MHLSRAFFKNSVAYAERNPMVSMTFQSLDDEVIPSHTQHSTPLFVLQGSRTVA